jgi:hypothetical protein
MYQAISLTDEPQYRRNMENLMNPIIETENFIATPVETSLSEKQTVTIDAGRHCGVRDHGLMRQLNQLLWEGNL